MDDLWFKTGSLVLSRCSVCRSYIVTDSSTGKFSHGKTGPSILLQLYLTELSEYGPYDICCSDVVLCMVFLHVCVLLVECGSCPRYFSLF